MTDTKTKDVTGHDQPTPLTTERQLSVVIPFSIVDQNMRQDANYAPYCGRCEGLVRMQRMSLTMAKCKCGGLHEIPPPHQYKPFTSRGGSKACSVCQFQMNHAIHQNRSSRAFNVGDCVILNYAEQPCSQLVAVVVKDDEEFYHCQYLNSDPQLDSYCKPPMKNRLERGTLVEDFGVAIRAHNGEYWCEQQGDSKATYADGKPRKWQERGKTRRLARPKLAQLLWPL